MENKIIFRSQNNDIIIEFIKEKVNRSFSFAKNNSEDRYLYHMVFMNNLGTIIKDIKISDCEMYILMDNIYNFIWYGLDSTSVSLSCKDSIGETFIYTIETENIISNTNFNNVKNIFKVMQYIDEVLIPIISFEISNSIVDLLNCIYDICIEGAIDKEEIIYTNTGNTIIDPKYFGLK